MCDVANLESLLSPLSQQMSEKNSNQYQRSVWRNGTFIASKFELKGLRDTGKTTLHILLTSKAEEFWGQMPVIPCRLMRVVWLSPAWLQKSLPVGVAVGLCAVQQGRCPG